MSDKIEKRGRLEVTIVEIERESSGEYPQHLYNQGILSGYCYFDRACEVFCDGRLLFTNLDEFTK